MSFTIDTSINLPLIGLLISVLFYSGGYAQKILTSLRAIERIAISVKALEMEVARLKSHLNIVDEIHLITGEKDLFGNDRL